MGHPVDARDYEAGAAILRDLGVSRVRLLTNNPAKCEALEELGIKVVERIPVVTEPNEENYKYLLTKQKRMGHLLGLAVTPRGKMFRYLRLSARQRRRAQARVDGAGVSSSPRRSCWWGKGPSIQKAFPAVGVASAVRRDLGRPRQARTRCLLVPREAQEEALELDAVVERCGREVLAAQSFVEGRGDGVHDPDQARGERDPRVAESINGLVAPSRKLASDRVGRRRGDVAVSVTSWDDAWLVRAHHGRAAGSRSAAVAAAASGCAAQRPAAATAVVWPSARSLSLDFATAVAAGGAAQRLAGLAAH